jgi:hypothetical protein
MRKGFLSGGASRMMTWREIIARPLGAAAVCSLLVWPAWVLGDEAARWFRWLVDRVVSRSDVLFSLATSDAGFYAIASGRAWASWIAYGLVAGLAAMLVTRWLAGRALSWLSVALVLAIWLGIRLVWDWDADDSFLLAGSRSRMAAYSPGSAGYSPGPYDGSLGFFVGFSAALVLAATPWRSKPLTM